MSHLSHSLGIVSDIYIDDIICGSLVLSKKKGGVWTFVDWRQHKQRLACAVTILLGHRRQIRRGLYSTLRRKRRGFHSDLLDDMFSQETPDRESGAFTKPLAGLFWACYLSRYQAGHTRVGALQRHFSSKALGWKRKEVMLRRLYRFYTPLPHHHTFPTLHPRTQHTHPRPYGLLPHPTGLHNLAAVDPAMVTACHAPCHTHRLPTQIHRSAFSNLPISLRYVCEREHGCHWLPLTCFVILYPFLRAAARATRWRARTPAERHCRLTYDVLWRDHMTTVGTCRQGGLSRIDGGANLCQIAILLSL